MRILLIKASNLKDVRLQKYIEALSGDGHELSFLGWDLVGDPPNQVSKLKEVNYMVKGYNLSFMLRIIGLFIWLFKSWLFLRRRKNEFDLIYCADFEAVLPTCFISKREKKIIYDIYDDVTLRYKMPKWISRVLGYLDKIAKSRSSAIIHVDEYRVKKEDDRGNIFIIKNLPFDFYNGAKRNDCMMHSYAVTGYLAHTRGMKSIYTFAANNQGIRFILAGRFTNSEIEKDFKSLPNCEYIGSISQFELFEKIKCCSGIFSLYDPSIEINKLAASNKLYDAMMLGIPVFVNEGILAAKYVSEKKVGLVLSYGIDRTWDQLKKLNVLESLKLGARGREIYLREVNFSDSVNHVIKYVTKNE